MQLTGFEKRKPGQLSGGQQQRVALARALVLRPRVLLLDEPLGALDARLRKDLQVELKTLQESLGITFVFVTHDQEEALTMSDRVAVMNGGRVEQSGPPQEIYEEPATLFVADFLGVSNLVGAEATGPRRGRLRAHGRRSRRCAPRRATIDSRGAVKAMIRPERVRIEPQGSERREPPAGPRRAPRLPRQLPRGARAPARRRARDGDPAERRHGVAARAGLRGHRPPARRVAARPARRPRARRGQRGGGRGGPGFLTRSDYTLATIVMPPRDFCCSVTCTLSAGSSSAAATSSRMRTVSASQNWPSLRNCIR